MTVITDEEFADAIEEVVAKASKPLFDVKQPPSNDVTGLLSINEALAESLLNERNGYEEKQRELDMRIKDCNVRIAAINAALEVLRRN